MLFYPHGHLYTFPFPMCQDTPEVHHRSMFALFYE
jgi:hypothetical protein